MRKIRNSISLCLVLASGAFAQGQTVNLAYKVAGVDRQTILYAPSGLGAHPPLVYVIHGFNMSGQQEVQLTQMNKVADTAKFIVVYPNALKNASNQQSWDMTGVNDYAYLMSLIDTVEGRYQIDRKRVYVSGFSMGGFLSFNLGCRYSEAIAAIAPVSGLSNQDCALKRPLPTLFTYGTTEGFDVKTFIQTGEKWVGLNGCSPTPKVTRPYPAGNPNSVVTRLEYTGCNGSAEVTIDTVQGGTHEWPMDTRTKVNNSVEVWNFFKRFSLTAPTRALPSGMAAARRTVSADYADGIVGLRGFPGPASVRVFDIRGDEVMATSAVQGRFGFSGHSPGVYRAIVESDGNRFTLGFVVP